MEVLVPDVVDMILKYMGDYVSLISKVLRDNYFRKNGIWIHFSHFVQKNMDIFPEKFYDYPLNLDLKLIYQDTRISSYDMMPAIISYFESFGKKMAKYVFDETVYLRYAYFEDLVRFPNLKKVSHVTCGPTLENLKFLINTGIIGCTFQTFDYTIKNIEAFKDVIPETKYDKEIIHLSKQHITRWAITIGRVSNLCHQTVYPEIKHLSVWICENISDLNQANFPKLKDIVFHPDITNIDTIHLVFPNTKIIIQNFYPDGIPELELEKIFKYGYHFMYTPKKSQMFAQIDNMKTILEIKKIIRLGEKYKNHNVTILQKYHDQINFTNTKKIIHNFNVILDFAKYKDEDLINFLKKILSDPDLVYPKINRKKIKVRGIPGSWMDEYCNLACEIYEKKSIYFGFEKAWDRVYSQKYLDIKRHQFFTK